MPIKVNVPTEWSMYTPAGNKSITTKATALVKKLEMDTSFDQKIKHVKQFACKIYEMSNTRSFGEAGDTEVRNTVSWFLHDRVGKAHDLPRDAIDRVEHECKLFF